MNLFCACPVCLMLSNAFLPRKKLPHEHPFLLRVIQQFGAHSLRHGYRSWLDAVGTPRAEAMVGTAVLRIVVSSDSIKKATATSHGRSRLVAAEGSDGDGRAINEPVRFI